MSRITYVTDPENTFALRAELECERYADWDIKGLEMCVGDRWIAVRDPDLFAALKAQLETCRFFQSIADDAHVEAFDAPDTAWENYYEHIKERAHG